MNNKELHCSISRDKMMQICAGFSTTFSGRNRGGGDRNRVYK